jgi:menaquinone-dependent protoporphyrinogen oxidase
MVASPEAPRRRTLRRIAIGVAGFAALGAGFVTWGRWRPAPRLARSECSAGGSMAKSKVLVAYATRAGSTGEVAQAIASAMCAQGLDAEVRPLEDGVRFDAYQAVVLGSPVRYGAWLPEMVKAIEAQRAALAKLPLAIFTLHMQGLDDSPASAEIRKKYSQPVHALVTPKAEAFFAGKVDPATLSFFERLAVKMVKSPVGDKRDWGAIQHWAGQLSRLLAAAP